MVYETVDLSGASFVDDGEIPGPSNAEVPASEKSCQDLLNKLKKVVLMSKTLKRKIQQGIG